MLPKREHATSNQQTYMLTTSTWERRALFRNERWAKLLIETLYHYRGSAYLLHEFVIMPDHIHILITPITSLEKAVQFIKGGFSYRAKNDLGSNLEIWQKGFQDHRIRDAEDYDIHVAYVRGNPMRKHLCVSAEDYPFSSAHPGFELDSIPQRLKPLALTKASGAAEAAPFQIQAGAVKAGPFQNDADAGVAEGAPLQTPSAAAKAAPFQNVTIDTPADQTSLIDVAAPELAPAPVQRKKASASTGERPTTNDQRRIHAQTH